MPRAKKRCIPSDTCILGQDVRKGSIIVVRGFPGVGKSLLALYFSLKAAKHDDKVLYISLVRPKNKVVDELHAFASMVGKKDVEKLEKHLKIVYYNPFEFGQIIDKANLSPLVDMIEEGDIKGVVIDSITALLENIGENERNAIIEKLFQLLEKLNVITVVIDDMFSAKDGYNMLHFKADIVVEIKPIGIKDGQRIFQMDIIKARDMYVKQSRHYFSIDKKGIMFYNKKPMIEKL